MWLCQDVRCEDVCEDVKTWRCENVWQTQMTDPTIRRTLRSDALGNRNVDVHCFACEFMVLHDFSCSFMAFMWKHVLFIGVFLLFIFSFSWIKTCWVTSSGHLKKSDHFFEEVWTRYSTCCLVSGIFHNPNMVTSWFEVWLACLSVRIWSYLQNSRSYL